MWDARHLAFASASNAPCEWALRQLCSQNVDTWSEYLTISRHTLHGRETCACRMQLPLRRLTPSSYGARKDDLGDAFAPARVRRAINAVALAFSQPTCNDTHQPSGRNRGAPVSDPSPNRRIA